MKTILVTSDLTYTPQNYSNVLEFVMSNSKQQIAGMVLIKINLLNIFGKVLFLYFSGCRNMAKTLTLNLFSTLLREKKKLFKKYNIPFVEVKNINNAKAISWLQKISPDLIVNMRARCIYKNSILRVPRLGCINIHHGILPKQRGLFCDLYALAENKETGFTIHQMTNQIDIGQIFYQEKIDNDKDYMKYLSKVSRSEGMAISTFINKIAADGFLLKGALKKCDNSIVTTTPDFKKIKQLQYKGIIL
jgi:folate-dependent phosphoribosylglycinamide formyltransferase PurN